MWRKFEEAHEDSGFHDHRHGPGADLSDGKGVVRFPSAVATMEASPDALLVSIETAGGKRPERMKGVVASHLARFASREAPLPLNWSAREG